MRNVSLKNCKETPILRNMKGMVKAELSLCLAYTRKIVLRTGGIAPRILILVDMQVGCHFHAPGHFTIRLNLQLI